MHGATSQRRRKTRLYQAAKRSIEPAADCRHGNSNAMNSARSDSPRRCYTRDGKAICFWSRVRASRFTTTGRKDRSRKECFKKLEKRERNNVAVVQWAIKIPFHSRYLAAREESEFTITFYIASVNYCSVSSLMVNCFTENCIYKWLYVRKKNKYWCRNK